jgi:hypothetical protein
LGLSSDTLFVGTSQLLAGIVQCLPGLPKFDHVASGKLDRSSEPLVGSFPKHLQKQRHLR